jgi:hypothetical protein
MNPNINYILTAYALRKINESRSKTDIIIDLAKALGCSENSVNRHLRENLSNGDLTKKAAIEVITKCTGLEEKKVLVAVIQKEVA